jgi:hypothetical protein
MKAKIKGKKGHVKHIVEKVPKIALENDISPNINDKKIILEKVEDYEDINKIPIMLTENMPEPETTSTEINPLITGPEEITPAATESLPDQPATPETTATGLSPLIIKPDESTHPVIDILPSRTINLEPEPVEKSAEVYKESKKPILIIATIILIVVAVVGVLIYLLISASKKATPGSAPQIPVVISPTMVTPVTATATEGAVLKSDIKIKILNGSGITGLAGKTGDNLKALGYTNIEIGNAEGPTVTATDVIFSGRVTQAVKEEIVTELQKTFTGIETRQTPPVNTLDVLITIGKAIKKP